MVGICIDLKSFYASVECRELRRDPLTTNLVVADASRTEKTICLAVSPSLKTYGIPGRARLFEVVQAVNAANAERARRTPDGSFSGRSDDARMLAEDPSLAIDYIVAVPRMSLYMEYSTRIYNNGDIIDLPHPESKTHPRMRWRTGRLSLRHLPRSRNSGDAIDRKASCDLIYITGGLFETLFLLNELTLIAGTDFRHRKDQSDYRKELLAILPSASRQRKLAGKITLFTGI